jgi:hypothetical protein
VPEIGEEAGGDEQAAPDARSSVVIEVGRNVRITIQTP